MLGGMSRSAQIIQQAQEAVRLGDHARAHSLLLQASTRDPKNADLACTLGAVLVLLKKPAQAEYHLQRAAGLDPDRLEVQIVAGRSLAGGGMHARAIGPLQRAIVLAPQDPERVVELSRSMAHGPGGYEGMLELLREGVAKFPGDLGIVSELAQRLLLIGRADEAAAVTRDAMTLLPESDALAARLASTVNYADSATPEEIFAAHRLLGEVCERGVEPMPPRKPEPLHGRPLRVGLISPNFHQHSVAYFIEALFVHHDRSAVHLTGYADHHSTGRADATTERLRSHADAWVEITGLSDAEAAQRVRADEIDVLVDLAGNTSGDRLGVMARRPAAVQATYCGYPNTTGLRAVDWRVVDAMTDPPGAEAWATERLIRVPGCFLCYTPDPEHAVIAPVPSVKAGHVTFGSFNTQMKVGPATIRVWSRILRAVAGSRLVLKNFALAEAPLREAVLGAFKAEGIEASRIDLLSVVDSHEAHLSTYGRVDVALDPFPYNGTTTTCEAIYMGVPVVTVEGRLHAGRVGVSLLRTLGLGELVAEDVEEYVRLAAELALDEGRRAEWRASLRGRFLGSPLCEGAAWMRGFERALHEAWARACAEARSV
jgi:protein O-GlcNAc transferase